MTTPLPRNWVDALFGKLTVRYGAAFAAQYRDLDINAVKDDWAEELAGFGSNPKAIAYALENAPDSWSDRPPNSRAFRTVCRLAPSVPLPQLPQPPSDPARVAESMAQIHPMMVNVKPDFDYGPLAHRALANILASCQRSGRITSAQAAFVATASSMVPHDAPELQALKGFRRA